MWKKSLDPFVHEVQEAALWVLFLSNLCYKPGSTVNFESGSTEKGESML